MVKLQDLDDSWKARYPKLLQGDACSKTAVDFGQHETVVVRVVKATFALGPDVVNVTKGRKSTGLPA